MIPIVALIVWIGVAPNMFIERSAGSVNALMERIDRVRGVRVAEAAAKKEAEFALAGTPSSAQTTHGGTGAATVTLVRATQSAIESAARDTSGESAVRDTNDMSLAGAAR
jgi:hypothetical protein